MIKWPDTYIQQEGFYCRDAEQALLTCCDSANINALMDRRESFRVLWNAQHDDNEQIDY